MPRLFLIYSFLTLQSYDEHINRKITKNDDFSVRLSSFLVIASFQLPIYGETTITLKIAQFVKILAQNLLFRSSFFTISHVLSPFLVEPEGASSLYHGLCKSPYRET